jgi:hypothetical protein
MPEPRYVYTFWLWPNNGQGLDSALLKVFRLLDTRVTMFFTEAEFKAFRSELSSDGFTLRAIRRTPYSEPEVVL